MAVAIPLIGGNFIFRIGCSLIPFIRNNVFKDFEIFTKFASKKGARRSTCHGNNTGAGGAEASAFEF